MPPTPRVKRTWRLDYLPSAALTVLCAGEITVSVIELVGRLVDRDGDDCTARTFRIAVRAELERAEQAVLDVLGEHLRDHVAA